MITFDILIDILGWAGGAMVVIAYLMISSGKVDSKSIWYQSLNLFGSIFLIVNTWYKGAYPSTAVNVIWVFIAFYGFYRIYKNNTKIDRI